MKGKAANPDQAAFSHFGTSGKDAATVLILDLNWSAASGGLQLANGV